MEYTHHYDSPLGGITMASDGNALTGLWFDGQRYFADTLEPQAILRPLPVFDQADRWLDLYFRAKDPGFSVPVRLKSEGFRKEVLEMLMTIPYGETVTYGEIARKLSAKKSGAKVSPRAVGGAVGHNPVSIIVPCHRVLGAGGKLTGYAGGTDRKQQLLMLEQSGRNERT